MAAPTPFRFLRRFVSGEPTRAIDQDLAAFHENRDRELEEYLARFQGLVWPNGGSWVDPWDVQISQGATSNITKTVNIARYLEFPGSLAVLFEFYVQMTAAGSLGADITFTLPIATGNTSRPMAGQAFYRDVGTLDSPCAPWVRNSSGGGFKRVDGTSTFSYYGVSPNIQIASGDVLYCTAWYTL